MKKNVLVVAALLLALFNSACGRKGPLREPVPMVPQAVSDFRVVQRGESLIFTWTEPASYLDGTPLGGSFPEIRFMELKDEGISGKKGLDSFMKYSRPLAELSLGKPEVVTNRAVVRLDLEKVTGKNYLFGLRTRGRKGGWSEISNLVSVRPEVLPLPPSGLRAEVEEHQISLSWEPPEIGLDGRPLTERVFYNLYREEAGVFRLLNDQPLTRTRFEDLNFSFGLTYRYLARSLVARGGEYRESADSEILEVKAVDVFPPATPAEVRALSGTDGVTISWLPNRESDLAGYRVYRAKEVAAGEGAAVLLTPENLDVPVFLDGSVEKNTGYVYSICAVDKFGNESPPARVKVKT
ncbi:MAG: Fibronectin type III domain protein [Candidatus Saccharicenans subterraneus]|uniref:Fibronectin type III domain protein n=1 Tax=Candidatus Saccharicenans subterraneus TaxID=2508984 RepID=A0A3E2BJI6_9BACT|nr:MAG: Fibronectin type III domain protein [Candidatus Saccharicenans subterraneum]